MTVRFSLKPFPGEEPPSGFKIEGAVGRRDDALSLACELLGNLSDLAIPSPQDPPGRRDRLWEETCLELFLAEKGSNRYWEFNLSPAGHWNVYRFTRYREGMAEETAFSTLPFHVRAEPRAVSFSLDLAPGKIIPAGRAIEASVCAVIKTVGGRTTHWALSHPGGRPDFHRMDGFVLKFPGE